MPQKRRIYLHELSRILDRSSHTIRGWEKSDLLPKRLLPHRNEKGWRYWTPSQVDGLKAWVVKKNMVPGKGLSGFTPSPDRVQEMFAKLRQPREIQTTPCPHCSRPCKNLAAHLRLAHPQAAA